MAQKRKAPTAKRSAKRASAKAAERLPDLTHKQMAFVHGILQGKTASDAYRAAYDCQGSSDQVIWNEASALRASPTIQAWLTHLRMHALDTGAMTIEGHISELTRLREAAISEGQISAAVQAEVHKGKVLGMYEERLRLMNKTGDSELIQALRAHLGEQAAALIATQLGLAGSDESEGQAVH